MITINGRVLVAGNMTKDILVWPVDDVRFDTTVWVHDIVTSLGGNGANTSYALGLLGGKVRLLGVAQLHRCQLHAAGRHAPYVQVGEVRDANVLELLRVDLGASEAPKLDLRWHLPRSLAAEPGRIDDGCAAAGAVLRKGFSASQEVECEL